MKPSTMLLLAVAACTPVPTRPVPVFDGSDGAPPTWTGDAASEQACRHLQELGCPLGDAPTCAVAFELDPKFGVDAACVVGAPTKAALQGCRVTCE